MYFKITNEKENHDNYQYHDGLNILNDNLSTSTTHAVDGFYFTTLEHIHKFYQHGINLRIIKLPTENPDFKMVTDKYEDKYRSNMIIFGEKYSLYDIDTYTKFNLDITKNKYIIDLASYYGHVHILDQLMNLMNSGLKIEYSHHAIDSASEKGHVPILDWWINSGLEIKYSNHAINLASSNGHINILDWWKIQSDLKLLELKYSVWAMDWASENNNIEVLNWWVQSGLRLKYSNCAMDWASANGDINVLNWWKTSGLALKYSVNSIDVALSNGHIHVLRWWKKSKLECKYTKNLPSIHNKKVLQWYILC